MTGLIDWTEAKVTDISNDFVFNYKAFGEKGLEALILAYKEAGGYYWPKMKKHIIELVAAYPVSIAGIIKCPAKSTKNEVLTCGNLSEKLKMSYKVMGIASFQNSVL